MDFIFNLFWIIIAYLFGSINFAIIIGKVFFKKDIRQLGSKNPGGSNAGRVFGKWVGILVITLDILKCFIIMSIISIFNPNALAISGLACCIGHCYPVYTGFKGGKAVASGFGYLLALYIFVTKDIVFTLIYPALTFFLVLSLSKIVSISSISAFIVELIISIFVYNHLLFIMILLNILIIYRHKDNIIRLVNGNENKVKFL